MSDTGFKSAKDSSLNKKVTTPIKARVERNIDVSGKVSTKAELIPGAPTYTGAGTNELKVERAGTVASGASTIHAHATEEITPGALSATGAGANINLKSTGDNGSSGSETLNVQTKQTLEHGEPEAGGAEQKSLADQAKQKPALGSPEHPDNQEPGTPDSDAPPAGDSAPDSGGEPAGAEPAESAEPPAGAANAAGAAAPSNLKHLGKTAPGTVAKPTRTGAPGSLAPKPGEPDPNKFGGTPFGKRAGTGGLGGRAASGGKKVANYMKRHPKGIIWGIASLISLILSIIVFILSIPFQIIHMAQTLLDHNFSAGNNIENKVSRRVMARLFQEKMAPNGGARQTKGNLISDKIANMKMDRFNKLLAKDGLKLEFGSDGRLSGIRNLTDGKLSSDFSESSFQERRTAVGDLVSERISPWRVLKRVKYTRLMRAHARVSFRFFVAEKARSVKDILLEKVRKGATTAEIAQANTDPKTNGSDPAKAGKTGAGSAPDAVQAVSDKWAATKDKALAIREGVKTFKASTGKFFGITGILALVCMAKQMADDAANKGYLDRVDQLIRVGNLLPTVVSQLYTGQNLHMDKVGELMTAYQGNPNATKDSPDTKGWDQSAAAKRNNKEPVNTNDQSPHYNPEFSQASNPNGFVLIEIVNEIDVIFNQVPGANWLCNVVNSAFGWLIQGVELVVGLVTAESSVVAATVAQFALQYVIFNVIAPKLLAAAASLAITGTENAVDMFNNGDAGLSLSAQDYQRAYGGRQLSDTEQLALVTDAQAEKVQVARSKGWFYRIMDINNTDSVAANLLMKVPHDPTTAIASLTSIPQQLSANLGAIFFGGLKPAYAAPTSDINPYHFQFYGFTKAEVDKYPDPIANENYLVAPIPGTSQTRLSVLGDSSTYSPEDGDDPSTTDLLHCFVNKYRNPVNQPDPTCGNIGSATAPNNSPSEANADGDVLVAKAYMAAGLPASVVNSAQDDFLRYRMELFYMHVVRGLECASNDQACYQSAATGTPAATTPSVVGNSAACQASEAAIDCAARLATAILANPNVEPMGARSDLVATAAKQTITNSDSCGQPARVHPALLFAMQQAATTGGFKIRLSNIITPHGCDSFLHPKGRAFDVDNLVDSAGHNDNAGSPGAPGNDPAVDRAFSEYIAKYLPSGGGIGQAVSCFPANIPAGLRTGFETGSACTHIHVDVGTSAP